MNKNGIKKTAIVVGGSSGIGCATCLKLLGDGWRTVNISRTPCKNSKVKNILADVSETEAFRAALEEACEVGYVGALIYSAGFSMAAPIEHALESDWRYLFEVNFFGALVAMQTVIPHMKESGGKIVLVGSIGGELPICFDSFYSSSKAALEMLCRAAYGELKQFGISVTGVLPGGTATNFTFKRKVYPDEENKGYSASVNRAVAALANMEQSGMSAKEVAAIICDVLGQENPPVIKACGMKNTVFHVASRMMPEKIVLKMNERSYRQ